MILKTTLKNFGRRIDTFWFRPVSAMGFGLMRIGFGLTALLTLVFQMKDIERYYGPNGILPHSLLSTVLRQEWRFSLLDYTSGFTTELLFLLLLLSLVLVTLGIGTRFMLAVSLILLSSFHEYGNIAVDGGDSMLRIIGFILLLSPCERALSLTRLQKILPSTMPIWPYRLLLWQMVIGYLFSGYAKWIGPAWRSGSAVSMILHVEDTARLDVHSADLLTVLSPFLSTFTMLSQLAWGLLLLLPLLSWSGFPVPVRGTKRLVLLCGVLVHIGIFLTMNLGIFPLIMLTAYLGLLEEEDIQFIRRLYRR